MAEVQTHEPAVVQPILTAIRETGEVVVQTTLLPIRLDHLPVHVGYFKQKAERDHGVQIVRVVIDLAM